jgi:hypothetical protein
MQKFLTFNTYTDPSGISTNYTKSNLGAAIGYSFVERTSLTSITVRLDSLPSPRVRSIVARIDASQFKRRGQLVDRNNDGISGDIFDDYYRPINIGNFGDAPLLPFFRPVQTVDLYLTFNSFEGNNTFSTISPNTQYFEIASVSSLDVTDVTDFELRTKVLDGIKDKFVVEKYNKANNTWERDSATIAVYNSLTTPPLYSGLSNDCVYIAMSSFEDLGIYRIKVTGMANLQSIAPIGDQPAKVRVNVNDNRSFRQDTYYSDPAIFINERRTHIQSLSNFSRSVNVTSDAHKQNVVLEWSLDSIDGYNSATDTTFSSNPRILTTDEFNRAVKLVYNKNGGSVNLSDPIDDLVELKIANVEYVVDKRTNPNNTKINLIRITLSGYQFSPVRNRNIHILINPNFKYDVETITFGGDAIYYAGQFLWRYYGSFVSGL